MREFLKVACVFVLMICGTAAAIVWVAERPDGTTRALRIVLPLMSVAAIGGFLLIHFQRDIAPDYLYQVSRKYFNRDGFCLAGKTVAIDGVGYLEVWFQNQHDRQCLAT
jgi:hypothetical protein